MAGKDYLAMYLQVKTGFNTESHFIPIMHFAENPARLRVDLDNNAFYTNEVVMGMAIERLRGQRPFRISVLFHSSLPASAKILPRSGNKQMNLIVQELAAMLKPNAQDSEVSMVSLKMGMKNKSTAYPKDFVDFDKNFTGGKYLIQFAHAKFNFQTIFIGDNFFTVLNFYRVTGQIFMEGM